MRGFSQEVVESLDVSCDSLTLGSWCSCETRGIAIFVAGLEGLGGRGFDGGRKPSYSRKSSCAPAVEDFSIFLLFSGADGCLLLENILLRSIVQVPGPLFTFEVSSCNKRDVHLEEPRAATGLYGED